MLPATLRSMLDEPAAPNPPARVWRDWVLVGGIVPIAILEGIFAETMEWRVLSVVVAIALLPTLLWRRTHPLASLSVAFGTLATITLISLAVGVYWQGLGTNVYVLLLLYSVFRWDSGRHAAIGLGVVAVPLLLSSFEPLVHAGTSDIPASNVLLGGMVLLVTAAVGATVRYQDNARIRGMDQAKLLEREQLARELHDTVAHHVSAIAIRAQAGRVVGATDPTAALDALVVIEEEASRTLTEMRALVGALRHGEEADLSPQRGVADLELLTPSATGVAGVGNQPTIEIERSGDLTDLRPSLDATVYRLAQESITNALRHSRNASRVRVSVSGETDCVRLTVADDGEPALFDPRSTSGFGLIGMAERTKLLGGTLVAGPNRHRGWTVTAELPRAQS